MKATFNTQKTSCPSNLLYGQHYTTHTPNDIRSGEVVKENFKTVHMQLACGNIVKRHKVKHSVTLHVGE